MSRLLLRRVAHALGVLYEPPLASSRLLGRPQDSLTGGVAGCIFDEFGTRFGPEFHNFLALAHHFLRSEFGPEICLKNVWIWDWPQVVK